jgi:hypothetical protein
MIGALGETRKDLKLSRRIDWDCGKLVRRLRMKRVEVLVANNDLAFDNSDSQKISANFNEVETPDFVEDFWNECVSLSICLSLSLYVCLSVSISVNLPILLSIRSPKSVASFIIHSSHSPSI